MSIRFHGEEDFVSNSAFDIDGVIGISNDERSPESFLLHLVSFDKFPMDEAGISSTVDEGILGDATLSLS